MFFSPEKKFMGVAGAHLGIVYKDPRKVYMVGRFGEAEPFFCGN